MYRRMEKGKWKRCRWTTETNEDKDNAAMMLRDLRHLAARAKASNTVGCVVGFKQPT